MRKTACAAAMMIVTMAATGCNAAGNPLIGKWKYTGQGYVDREGTRYCGGVTKMLFTPTKLTRWNAANANHPASVDTQPVNYLVNGKKVYVSSAQSFGSGQYWTFLDSRKIQSDNMDQCVFARE